KLLKKLDNTTDRRAQFVCVISVSGPDMETKVFKVTVSGEIADGKYGEHGFGYDPIFYVPTLDRTMAQLSKEQKGQISHRRNAINLLEAYLAGDQND
ncbi:non-canonical purine NTP pyrophosphatase, partial [Staphylococcus aureus]|uniref:non-canonical purine NTP pyrophosphatase n=1 Tax=Staphylococcus aureus TaxID=1280 RepID=UPI00272EE457